MILSDLINLSAFAGVGRRT